MIFPRKLWVELSHEEICNQMDEEFLSEDPDELIKFIIARIEWAETITDLCCAKTLLEIEGLNLI